ncbi:MAG: PLDc_N domain-containing protein [SAR202 cluster bacterium]|nr:PLDc_N domain-containing protein [SAR202 cluster bacterium]
MFVEQRSGAAMPVCEIVKLQSHRGPGGRMDFSEILPLLISVLIIQVTLLAFALKDLLKPERRVKGGNKVLWGVIIVVVNLIGPVAYLVFGREEA